MFTLLEYGCIGYAEEDAINKFGEDKLEVSSCRDLADCQVVLIVQLDTVYMYIYSLVTWKEAGGGLWDIIVYIVYIVYNLWSTAYIVIRLYPTLPKY